MSDGFQFYDIIFFALIAIFIVLRLRAVLGRRTGHERQPDTFARSNDAADEHHGETPEERRGNVVHLPDRGAPDDDPEASMGAPRREAEVDFGAPEPEAQPSTGGLQAGLTQIRLADPEFSPRRFIEGAKMAFEMVVDAFAKGDTATLRPLLGDDVYDEFAAAIRGRLAAEQTHDTTIVSLDDVDLVQAVMRGSTALVSVKFVSQQINVTRDKDEEIVDGDESRIEQITDIWTFARNTRSSDPNWSLVETSAPA